MARGRPLPEIVDVVLTDVVRVDATMALRQRRAWEESGLLAAGYLPVAALGVVRVRLGLAVREVGDPWWLRLWRWITRSSASRASLYELCGRGAQGALPIDVEIGRPVSGDLTVQSSASGGLPGVPALPR